MGNDCKGVGFLTGSTTGTPDPDGLFTPAQFRDEITPYSIKNRGVTPKLGHIDGQAPFECFVFGGIVPEQ